ncbi:NADH:ubiquinone oxidoreductase subunit F (NADH-binding) [Amycolatopsis bartoniae]|uniref:NADH dehydrogenase n=1 Tax=Amycolatopsis bartoniae TaxID=941986 RepID=A0A8H9MDF2_9PSEU|nr:NADH-ubiquinone oxidoreductase-F iron-sulfur binding region domain-containing protein [Amycolatopsis bartoniae]MBB2935822.1 NADH:ubiquinone oxidoreductase subunit F (NADH-binding) [Amycolatopsis bartoniae]TVS98719.1 NADH-quinone oxidoreductase subunit F [Amycolatopsis bartoniae]GHF62098.1 NADH dehydrogenase [Amycolatopsis bartoniae]
MTAVVTVTGLLDAAAPDLPAHLARSGPIPWRRPLVEHLRQAGLTGRGGAGFPVWRKLSTVAEGASPVVVANAAEGEPASAKDHTLLTRAPHLVLDGLQLAAEAVRAAEAYLYVPRGPAADAVLRALPERSTWDALPVTVVTAPDYFVAGQESAVVAAIEGRPALPADRLDLTARSGVRGRPTLVQNVETLAHVAQIARYGPEWFRQRGTAAEPGTFLATVSGAVRQGGVVEAPLGIPLDDLLARAGGPARNLRAVLVGGYHGTWIPASDVRIPLSRAALGPLGGSVGAGVVVALDDGQCGLEVATGIVTYLANQSARQCGPCLNGLPALARTMTALVRGEGRPEQAHRLADLVERRGACHHPDGAARFVRSSLAVFGDEIACHLRGGCAARRTA